jgi:hypothetical protein
VAVPAGLRGGLAAGVLYVVLVQPNHPGAMTWGALAVFPLELPVLLLALVALPASRVTTVLRLLLVAALVTLAVLKAADYGTYVAFNRGFNAVTDWHLAAAAFELGRGTLGTGTALLAAAGALLAVLALAVIVWWATGVWAAVTPRPGLRVAAAVLAVPALALATAEIAQARGHWRAPLAPPGAAFTARVGLERTEQWRATRADLAAFRAAAAHDAFRDAAPLYDRLRGADVVLTYVESYGRSSFENPLYVESHTGTLRGIEARLAERGLAMRSGWLTAPTIGGQSWLAHGTVASGMWLDTQARYRALLASDRRTLFHHAQEAGLRTVAVMPAHVFPWPEGDFFGFDAVYDAAGLGYAGEPFNWVTMPDQFTLAAFDRLERGRAGRPPLFAQIVLISSHAPWLPVPPVIGWDEIGDGTVFNRWARTGDPPEVVWRDPDRVREKFRLAIDYSLQTVGAYAELHADANALTVVVGDHEPARFVAGTDGFDVPVHLIGPPELIALFDGWGWTPGLVPDAALPAWRMDALRDALLAALATGAPARSAAAGEVRAAQRAVPGPAR